MKTMKKLLALIMALTMVFALAATGFAAGPDLDDPDVTSGTNAQKGEIVIKNAIKDQEYVAYKIFDLESFNEDTDAFSYKVDEAWVDFFKEAGTDPSTDPAGKGNAYVEIDANGYVKWKDNADPAEFAKLAVEFASTATGITKYEDPTVSDDGKTVTFSNLDLGYYVVDSSTGALCSLDTTHLKVEMFEKNEVPTPEKKVSSTDPDDVEAGETWDGGEYNTGSIGDTVYFETTIHAHDGAQNYVLHDKMDNGLTLDSYSIKVYVVKNLTTGDKEPVENPENGTANYTLNTNCTDNCTFEITFDNDYLASIGNELAETKTDNVVDFDFVVTYEAKINENCTTGTIPNTNDTWLKYGDESTSTHDKTFTFVYELNVLKYAEKTEDGEITQIELPDAKFYLYRFVEDENAEKTYVQFLKSKTDDATPDYTVNDWTEAFEVTKATGKNYIDWEKVYMDGFAGLGATEFVTDENGHIFINGLAADTYFLHESEPPEGYNILDYDVVTTLKYTVTTDASGDQTATWETTGSAKIDLETNEKDEEDGTPTIMIENKFGTLLPATGGIGTTLFYVIGSIMMVGAAVLLISKKRMSV